MGLELFILSIHTLGDLIFWKASSFSEDNVEQKVRNSVFICFGHVTVLLLLCLTPGFISLSSNTWGDTDVLLRLLENLRGKGSG